MKHRAPLVIEPFEQEPGPVFNIGHSPKVKSAASTLTGRTRVVTGSLQKPARVWEVGFSCKNPYNLICNLLTRVCGLQFGWHMPVSEARKWILVGMCIALHFPEPSHVL